MNAWDLPKHEAWYVCGTDLVRDENGEFRVLEDNLRVPSGVSYMIENRELTKRVLPELFENHSILPVDDYPSQLYKTLCSIAPSDRKRPTIVCIGIFNSAYFEHAYLAQELWVLNWLRGEIYRYGTTTTFICTPLMVMS